VDSNDDDDSGPFISKFSMMKFKSPKRQTSSHKSLTETQQSTFSTISVNIDINGKIFD